MQGSNKKSDRSGPRQPAAAAGFRSPGTAEEAATKVPREQAGAAPEASRPAPQEQPLSVRDDVRWRVLLVDDHRLMREGLQALLEEETDIEVVGQAGNGVEAVQKADVLRPDVVVMDVLMPVMDGVEAARQIRAQHPEIRIIGLSMFDEADMARKMLQAGASTYLPKAGPAKELLAAIRGK
jgi:CheY-like chemotaxis protein